MIFMIIEYVLWLWWYRLVYMKKTSPRFEPYFPQIFLHPLSWNRRFGRNLIIHVQIMIFPNWKNRRKMVNLGVKKSSFFVKKKRVFERRKMIIFSKSRGEMIMFHRKKSLENWRKLDVFLYLKCKKSVKKRDIMKINETKWKHPFLRKIWEKKMEF